MQPLDGDVSPRRNKGEESHSRDVSPEVKTEKGQFAESSPPNPLENTLGKSPNPTLSGEEDDDEVQITENDDEHFDSNDQNQLVVYNPDANGVGTDEPVSDHVNHIPPPLATYAPIPPPRVLPSVGAFTVQCARCFKWRLIPTKEKYEEIRETILQQPFNCERASEWRPDISCDDPPDISQDGSRIWAIDKPNIAQPPPGWERILRIRGEGSSKFADVYYAAPSGKRLRSMVEVRKYLFDHPEYMSEGVSLSQFSFQTPRPLQEDYVRKRPRNNISTTRSLEPAAVNPLSWVRPVEEAEQNLLGEAATSEPDADDAIPQPIVPPAKKKKTKSSSKQKATNSLSKDMYNNEAELKAEKFQPDSPHDP